MNTTAEPARAALRADDVKMRMASSPPFAWQSPAIIGIPGVMKKHTAAVVLAMSLLLGHGTWQAAWGLPVLCLVTQCEREGGQIITEACDDVVTMNGSGEAGSGAGGIMTPDGCETLKALEPCDAIPECQALAATREAPALGGSALLFATFVLGTAGTLHLRRKSSRRS